MSMADEIVNGEICQMCLLPLVEDESQAEGHPQLCEDCAEEWEWPNI